MNLSNNINVLPLYYFINGFRIQKISMKLDVSSYVVIFSFPALAWEESELWKFFLNPQGPINNLALSYLDQVYGIIVHYY